MIRITKLEVHGIRDFGEFSEQVPDNKADYFGLFGLVEGPLNSYYIAIGDYPTRPQAELIKDLLETRDADV